jgi:hypothetical protein
MIPSKASGSINTRLIQKIRVRGPSHGDIEAPIVLPVEISRRCWGGIAVRGWRVASVFLEPIAVLWASAPVRAARKVLRSTRSLLHALSTTKISFFETTTASCSINSRNNINMADSTPPSSSPPTAPSQRPPTPTAPRGIAAAEALSSARQAFFEAQRRYPHDASVFVGNLPAERTDLNLLHCVEDLSRRFGTCEVMINRGKAAIPTAVVQYQVCLHSLHELAQITTNSQTVAARGAQSHHGARQTGNRRQEAQDHEE